MDDDDFTKSDDLLYSITYGIRKFYFSGSWNDAIIGVILEENNDSFLIALPARIVIEGNLSLMEAITNLPCMRFLKGDIRAVNFCEGVHNEMYIEFLTLNSPNTFPGLLDMIGETSVREQAEKAEDQMQEDMQNLSLEHMEKGGEQEVTVESKGVLIQGNFTDAELQKKVEKAIRDGMLIPSQGKLAN